jgi:hypothetical protein
MCETADMPSSASWQPFDVLRLAWTAVNALVPIDQLESLHWYHHPGEQPLIEITLSEGESVSAYLPDEDICLEYGPGDAICTIFASLQQDLPCTAPFWGQPMPPCRTGHPHAAWCRQSDNVVELYCPADQQTLRTLAILPGG